MVALKDQTQCWSERIVLMRALCHFLFMVCTTSTRVRENERADDIVRGCFNKGHLYDVIHVLSTYPVIQCTFHCQSLLQRLFHCWQKPYVWLDLLTSALWSISLKVLRNDLIRGHCWSSNEYQSCTIHFREDKYAQISSYITNNSTWNVLFFFFLRALM